MSASNVQSMGDATEDPGLADGVGAISSNEKNIKQRILQIILLVTYTSSNYLVSHILK